MKKSLIIPVFFLLLCAFTFQNISDDQTTWERYFLLGQVGEDWALTSCVATDGNYLIGGYTKDLPNKSSVIKMTPDGDTLWARKFERNIVETVVARSICPTVDNGCIFGGSTNKLNLVKLDENGNIVWNNNYTEDPHSVSAIRNMQDGSFVVSGIRWPFTARILKIDKNGDIIWDRLHPELSGFGPFVETSDSGVIVLSEIQSTAVVKFSKDGIIEWQSPAPNGAFPRVINSIADNKFLLSGRIDFIISESGDVLSQFQIPVFSGEFITGYLYSSTIDSISKMLRGTNSWLSSSVISRIVVYDLTGNILNEKIIIDSNNNSRDIMSINQVEDGYLFTGIRNYYIGNETSGKSIGRSMVIKTDSLLNYKTVGINDPSILVPQTFKLHQNYPNPFNPSTTISFDIPQTALVKLSVYDALGREVATLVNENLTAGSYNYQWTIDNAQLGSGVYFYRLQAGSFVETKRLVLLK